MKKFFKCLALACGGLALGLSLLVTPAASVSVQAAVAPTDSINKQYIEWIYLRAEGKLYKRLFNYSTGQWIGEWIYVRDLINGK